MRVFVADKLEAVAIAGLEQAGCEVLVKPGLSPDDLAAAVAAAKPDVIVVRSTKVPAKVIDAAAGLKAVIRAGAGFDNIDTQAAGTRGVSVCNTPGMNAVAVAELTMGHILSLDRRLGVQTQTLASGQWNKDEFGKAQGIKGRSLLIIGTGAIGTEVIKRAKAFDMHVAAQSRSLREDTARALGIEPIPYTREALLAALSRFDVVSVHVASTPHTRGLCDRDFFAAMKPGTLFINTSRGDIVDEAALIDAIKTKGVRAGLDVYAEQPSAKKTEFKPAIAALGGDAAVVSLSHHCGASTEQAQTAVAEEVVRIVRTFRDEGRWMHVVNQEQLARA